AGSDGSKGFVLTGTVTSKRSDAGYSVSTASDANGDGIHDPLVGDPYDYVGTAYVLFGRDTAHAGLFPAVFPLESLLPNKGGDGSLGFAMVAGSYLGASFFSTSLSAAGDVNGDGIADILAGSPIAPCVQGSSYCGRTYV